MEAREKGSKMQQVEGGQKPAPRALWQVGGMHLVLAKVAAVGPIVATRDTVRAMEAGFSQKELMDPTAFYYFTVASDGLHKPSQVWARTEEEAHRSRQELLGALDDFYMADRVEVLTEETTVTFFERG